jgi:hypothetical protein
MTWRLISPRDNQQIQMALLLTTCVWGISYMAPPGGRRATPLTHILLIHGPLAAFGAVMVIASVSGLFSELIMRRTVIAHRHAWFVSWCAHKLMSIMFSLYTVGSIWAQIHGNGSGGGSVDRAFYGVELTGVLALMAFMHSRYAKQMDYVRAGVPAPAVPLSDHRRKQQEGRYSMVQDPHPDSEKTDTLPDSEL